MFCHIAYMYLSVIDGRTDGRTDGRRAVVIPRYVWHRAVKVMHGISSTVHGDYRLLTEFPQKKTVIEENLKVY